MYTENYRISVILTRQQEGGYTVKCEELPEFLTDGNSVDEALANVGDAFVATLELYSDLDVSCRKAYEWQRIVRPM